MSRVLVPIFLLLAACGGGDEEHSVVEVVPTSPLAPSEEIADGDEPSGPPDRTTFRDEETGSLWNLAGLAVDGPLAGTRLQQLPGYSAYWFAWSSFWPNTAVWGQQDGSGAFAAAAFQPIESGFLADVPIDAIPPLDDPYAGFGWALFDPADDVSLSDADIVVGVEVDGDARAYPVRILNFHEIVNHTVGDRQLIVTYCPLTASGVVFEGGEAFGNTAFSTTTWSCTTAPRAASGRRWDWPSSAASEPVSVCGCSRCFKAPGGPGRSCSRIRRFLVRATGLHKGSIYKAFDDKHDLFIKSLTRYLEGAHEAMRIALSGPESPLEGLRTWLHGVVLMCREQPVCRGCLAMNTAVDTTRWSAPCSSATTHVPRRF